MSGIKNIKKKLKGFQVRPPNVEVLKKVLLHIPYVVVFYVVNKCTWLYQYCRGSTVVDRLIVLFMNYPLAFKKLLPSIQPKSLAAGTIAAVSVWAVVYFKGKNGKKFRQGEEYGSARWGNEKDIAPFIDPVFENNILLTQTERLTMNSRPKKPKYARNKNVIVIGGSGSGKTRFYVKPQLMQMPDNVSFVVTDPKGTIIVECGKMLARGTPKKDKNGKILRDKNGRVVMAPYKIKVLNTINFAKSMHYNPFHYIRSEKDILKLQEGMKAIITSDALDDQEINGEIIKVVKVYNASQPTTEQTGKETSGAANTGGFSVQIKLDPCDLISGMSAKAKIVLTDRENVLSVPYDLVQQDEDGKSYVLCAEENKDGTYTAVKKNITVGDEINYYTEVTGGDLIAGDYIIMDYAISEGDTFQGERGSDVSETEDGGSTSVSSEVTAD